MIRIYLKPILFFFVYVLPWNHAQAQNFQRQEEEAIKDKERDIRYQEYILQRKAEEEALLKAPLSEEELETKNLVEVEPNNILPAELSSTQALVPYKIRRPRWGHLFSITYSQFNPVNYEPDVNPTSEDFETLYGTAQTPLIELSYAYKWNMSLGSIGGEISYGVYSNENAEEAILGDAKLDLQIARLGLRYNIDNFSLEPKLVPYGFAGVYTVIFDETQADLSFNGTTGPAIYYGGGLMLQLGWLDPVAAVDAYTESGIENTFVFAEARQFLSSSEANDPDFSTDVDFNFGLSLEF